MQDVCNGRNGRNGTSTRGLDGRRGHPDLRWDSTTQSTRGFDGRRGHPDLRLMATSNLKENADLGPPGLKILPAARM